MLRIRDAHLELTDTFQLGKILNINIFRGDSWQSVLSLPSRALRAAVYIRCRLKEMGLKGRDSRIGIGIGPVSVLPSEEIETGDGIAFVLSGNCLDNLGKRAGIGIQIYPSHEIFQVALNAIVVSTDYLVRELTDKQSIAVGHALKGWSHQKIAEAWKEKPISRQSVTKHLKAAGWSILEEQIQAFERIVSMLIGRIE